MRKLLSLFLRVAQELSQYPEMNYLNLYELTIHLRTKKDSETIPTPDEVLQDVLQNCEPDVLQQIFHASRILMETITTELDCQGRKMTFGEMMKALREQPPPSHDPEELPPTHGRPRIILTFEFWDIVVHLHRFHMQMLVPPIRHFILKSACARMVKPAVLQTFQLRCLTNGQNPRRKIIVLSLGLVSCFFAKMRKLAKELNKDPGNRIAKSIKKFF